MGRVLKRLDSVKRNYGMDFSGLFTVRVGIKDGSGYAAYGGEDRSIKPSIVIG